jgi:Fur family ferric uptake transcriptional regulator
MTAKRTRGPSGVDAVRAALRAHGLRATYTRIAILAAIRASARPSSFDDLARRLASLGLDRTTMRRSLADLAVTGAIRRFRRDDQIWRYARR